MAWTGSFGGIQLAAALVWRVQEDSPESLAPPWGWLEGWAQLCPFPSLNGLRASPGGVPCRVVASYSVTVVASGSDGSVPEMGKIRAHALGLETGTASLPPQTTGQSSHRACLDAREGTATSSVERASKNLWPLLFNCGW